ncbi:MAG: vitamin K epoxide reductase family protein [Anaerolineales bacterium]
MSRTGRAFLATGIFFLLMVSPVRAQETSVKAVLFYNPNCGACKTLINETLPPLLLQHNSSLLIFTVDVTNPEGGTLYESALAALAVPADQRGVPLLMVENLYLSGLTSIQAQFPGLIDRKLSEGGTGWPAIPGLEDALQKAGFTRAPMNPWEKFLNDQPANSLAILVLAFLFLSLVFSILITFRPAPKFMSAIPAWVFPVLLLIGMAVASYLTYTELTQSEVFCGGISRCQEVQDSQYSKIMGLISIGEFGIFGYLLIGLSWIVHRFARGNLKTIAAVAMFGFAVFGVSFSIYLTFLEPFVIGATCLWCLTSATIMALILPLTTGPVGATIQPYAQTPPNAASGG